MRGKYPARYAVQRILPAHAQADKVCVIALAGRRSRTMNTPEEKTIGAVLGIFALAAALLLSACNTVKGVGRDIESVGNAGEKAINK